MFGLSSAHGWKPENIYKHIAETLMVLAEMGVTDTPGTAPQDT